LHGIVHTLEGDLDNARYWYRRTTREFPGPDAVKREIAAARLAQLPHFRKRSPDISISYTSVE
ncbi:MAG: hypothetical protein ACREJS_08465, partial [Candidatus Rokuibacteriota bacterium]